MIDIGTAVTALVWLIEAAWFVVLYVHTRRLDSDDRE